MSSGMESWPVWVMGSQTLTMPRAQGSSLLGHAPAALSGESLPSCQGKHRRNPWILQRWASPLSSHKVLFLAGVADSPLPSLDVWYPPAPSPPLSQERSRISCGPPVLLSAPAVSHIIGRESSDQAQSEGTRCSTANFMLKKDFFFPPLIWANSLSAWVRPGEWTLCYMGLRINKLPFSPRQPGHFLLV